jgi:hypothetical protein
MEKPIVFLSHSSKDRGQLSALKNLLDQRASGLLDFFLSSDGESLKFGRNWVVSVADALEKAQLMFVFLSPNSVSSSWVHFEAGHAIAKGLKVVPVCIPGMDLNRMTPPLSLLQGFNLHGAESMANVVRLCNQQFAAKILESFTPEDFARVFAKSIAETQGFFGKFSRFISRIWLRQYGEKEPTWEPVKAIPTLIEISRNANVEFSEYKTGNEGGIKADEIFETPGCEVTVSYDGNDEQSIICSFSPQLFHINAPLLDISYSKVVGKRRWFAELNFTSNVDLVDYRPELTTRLLNSGIRVLNRHNFDFRGL